MTTASTPPVDGRRRTVTLMALFVVAIFAWGLCFYGLGFYLQQLNQTRGWSIASLSTLTFGYYAAATYLSFPVSRALARRGPQPVFFLGGVLLGVALWLLPRVDNLALMGLVYLVLAIAWSSISLNAISTTVLAWYGPRGQRPLTTVLIGASVGGIVLIPGLIELSTRWGLTATLSTVGIVASLTICLLAVVAIREPVGAGNVSVTDSDPGDPRKQGAKIAWAILRTGQFWVLSTGLALSVLVQAGFLVHQLTLLNESVDASAAGRLVAATTASAMIGRFTLIGLNDRVPTALAGAAFLFSQMLGLVVISAMVNTMMVLLLGCCLFGFGVGVLISMPPLLTRATFPDLPFTATYPVVITLYQFGTAAGAPVTALARQTLGDYRGALAVLAGAELIAIVLFIAGHRRSMAAPPAGAAAPAG